MQILESPAHEQQATSTWRVESGGDLALDAGRMLTNLFCSPIVWRPKFNCDIHAFATTLIFPALWLFIGMVSSWDAYLTIKYREHICSLESNPVGRLLLRLDGGEPSLFIGAKFLGTILVLGLLVAFFRYNRRLGYLLTGSIAAFQFGLLCYLALR